MDFKLQFATKAIVIKDDKVLALYSNTETGTKWWDLPGGRIEFGETPEEGLKREVFEELGREVKILKLIDTWNHMPADNWQIVGVFYLCTIDSEDIILSDEHDGFEWISITELSKFFTAKTFIERINGWNWDALMDMSNRVVYPVVEVDIDKLIPNNLYLNGDKVNALADIDLLETYDTLLPVMVTEIEGELSLIDGHSRVWSLWKLGLTKVRAIVYPVDVIGMPEFYTKIHGMAKSSGITHISKLENHILYGEDHADQWVGLCNRVMAELE